MNTATLVQASADIMRITTVKRGDVYKRLEDNSYGEDKLIFGIVTDVLNNGTQSAVIALEFKAAYSSMETSIKTFAGGRDLAIFPATQEEVQTYLADSVANVELELERAVKAVDDARDKLDRVKEIANGTLAKSLSTPTYVNTLPSIEADEAVPEAKLSGSEPF